MILIDPRAGSGELDPLFNAYDVEHALGQLDFADVMFPGNGPDGDVLVGVERKRLSDMITCMRDKRFSGYQLPGLLAGYEYPYLLVEGIWNVGGSGELVRLNGRGWVPYYNNGSRAVLYRELSSYLASLELRAIAKSGEPLRVVRTSDPKESVAWLVGLYKNFNDKTWNQHRAHNEVYAPVTQPRKKKPGMVARNVPLMEKMVCQIPGLDQLAEYVAKAYPMPEDFARMTVQELAVVEVKVQTRDGAKVQRLGKARAEKILPLLRRVKQ